MNAPAKSPAKYRVVQWATGNIGRRALRTVIEHPQMELVGLYVSSAEKVGQDAGTLCGISPVGIKATNIVDDIVALDADCVLHMRQGIDFGEICRLLASGKNIVTTRGEFHNPRSMDAAIRARVEQACKIGGTSIHSTGASPGFITEALTLPLIAMQRRLDCLTIDEYANCSRRDSPDMLFNIMGIGTPPGDLGPGLLAHFKEMFENSLSLIADAINMPFDDCTIVQDHALANKPVEIVAGKIAAGTVLVRRFTVTGLHKGKPVLRFRANWYCGTDIDEDWDLRETGWRVRVEGDTPLDVSITCPIPIEDYTAVMPGFTAHRAVNAIPAVCAAPPGIRTTVDLPQIIATF